MRAKKSLGQNFLVDPRVVNRILDSVSLSADELVLEIGPGLGALTAGLVARAGYVLAVELDRELVDALKGRFPVDRFKLFHEDILKFPLSEALSAALSERPSLKPKVRVVANLPYYISTAVITRLISERVWISDMTLMLQREVAERLMSRPKGKDYSGLTVFTQLYANVRRVLNVPAGAFRPVPKVESTVVRLDFKPQIDLEPRLEKPFSDLVKTAFSQRRKTLYNCLKTAYADSLLEVLADAGIAPDRRAETLSVEEFVRLAVAIDLHSGTRS